MIPYDLPPGFVLLFLFLYGAALGSFLGVCVHRLPPHEHTLASWRALWNRPSHCDRCGKNILARDNIPIFGWLFVRGRCRYCKRGIPGRYPLIELANGLLFVLVYWMEIPLTRWSDFTSSCLSCALSPSNFETGLKLSAAAFVNWRFAYHLMLVETLFVASLIDWDHMIIPDSVTLPAMFVGIIGAGVFGKFWLVPLWFQEPSIVNTLLSWWPPAAKSEWLSVAVPRWIDQHPHAHGLAVSLAGLVVGGGLIWAVRLIGQWTLRREAMGFGDVVLMAAIGSFIGWQPVVVVFFVAPLLALISVVVTRMVHLDREIPYGPYLSVGTLVVLLGWKWIFPVVKASFSLGPVLPVIAVVVGLGLLVFLLAVQAVKRAMGLPLYPDSDGCYDEWTSADQLTHFSGENVDLQQGQWRRDVWPGDTAARGQSQLEQWRRPHGPDSNQQWHRRQ